MLYVINFKTYREGTGKNAVKLAKIIKDVFSNTNNDVVVAVQPADVSNVSKIVTTFSQHVDSITFGPNTGKILPESIKEAGGEGTLLNHSERKIPLEEVEFSVKRCKEIGIKTIVCCSSPTQCKDLSKLNPDYIAIEPPELIGTGRSVSSEKPEVIRKSKDVVNVPLLCGAGISSREDVKKAKELGADGVLVSSAVVKSKNPYKILKEMII